MPKKVKTSNKASVSNKASAPKEINIERETNIQRRDFLNGVALGIAASLAPSALLFGKTPAGKMDKSENLKAPNTLNTSENLSALTQAIFHEDVSYPPSLLGLRGSDNASYAYAHLLRDGEKFDFKGIEPSAEYDLVVVGAGISGLAAACLYKEKHKNSKILILDNHDDFGGHARRNEFDFEYNGARYNILSYAGSESLQSPKSLYSKEVVAFLKRFGLKIDKLAKGFDVGFYQKMGLTRGVYFDKQIFGSQKIVIGNPSKMVSDDVPASLRESISFGDFVAQFPLNKKDKAKILELFTAKKDYLAHLDSSQKLAYLEKTSYLDFLEKQVGLSKEALKYFDGISDDFSALGIDAISCDEARESLLPGFEGLALDEDSADNSAYEEPYIYHAPDGNATIARLLVKYLIPQVAPKARQKMEDIILAKFDYSKLDSPAHSVHLRLKSTAINVENLAQGAQVCYAQMSHMQMSHTKEAKIQKVLAKKVIMANYNSMIPYIIPTLPQAQREALSQNVKTPLIYAKAILRDWRSFAKLGVYDFYAPGMPFARVSLDYPVSLGGYAHEKSIDKPICVHMVCSPVALARRSMDLRGMSAKDQARVARHLLYDLSFDSLENMLRTQLGAMLADSGFKQEDILAITINRWGHCYSYSFNSLFDDKEAFERAEVAARTTFGNIAIANSDAGHGAYVHVAIEQAIRAVGSLS